MNFTPEKDNTGCKHWLDGDTRKENGWEMGWCGTCNHEVAYKLDGTGKRTGETYLLKKQGPVQSGSHNLRDTVSLVNQFDTLSPREKEQGLRDSGFSSIEEARDFVSAEMAKSLKS
jgi:hypothetical protein